MTSAEQLHGLALIFAARLFQMVGTSSCVTIGKSIEAGKIARQRTYRFERE